MGFSFTGERCADGRIYWTCDACKAGTFKRAETELHICGNTDLGKTTSDEEADRVLEAAGAKIGKGLELFSLQAQDKLLAELIKLALSQARKADEGRGKEASSRAAGAIEGKVQALTEYARLLTALRSTGLTELEAAERQWGLGRA